MTIGYVASITRINEDSTGYVDYTIVGIFTGPGAEEAAKQFCRDEAPKYEDTGVLFNVQAAQHHEMSKSFAPE